MWSFILTSYKALNMNKNECLYLSILIFILSLFIKFNIYLIYIFSETAKKPNWKLLYSDKV